MNKNFIKPTEKVKFPWMIDSNGKIKAQPIGVATTEPVITKLPLAKSDTELKLTNYNNGGENKKKTASWLPDLFSPKLPEEVKKWMEENPPKNNSDSYQKNDDKSNNMCYDKNKNNSSSAEDAAYNAAIMKLHSEAVPSEEKLPEKLFPEKEEWEGKPSVDAETEKRMLEKQRENNSRAFWEEVDYNDLPTEEQMDFADGAFGNLPGFRENNEVLRHLRRFTDNGEPVESAITKAFGVVYGGKDLTPTKYSSNATQENSSKKADSVADPEVESRRQAARRKYEERSRKEATEEEVKYPQDIDEAIETYSNYFDEETRKRIREGEGIASFLDGLNPEETDQIYNYLQDKFKNLDPEIQKEFGFYTEDIFAGVPLEARRKIFKKLKTGEEVTYEDLVEYGLYDGEEKFFEKWAANDFTSLVNKAYDAYELGTSLDELSFEYNAQQAAQAQALFMEVLLGRVNGNSINLSPNSKKEVKSTPQPVRADKSIILELDDDIEYTVDDFTDPKVKKQIKFKENKKTGATAEIIAFSDKENAGCYNEKQITIVTASGRKTRADIMSITPDGQLVITEVKGSLKAWLNRNQAKALPEIYQFGGKVVGKGKGLFHGGYEIPPGTKIEVVNIDVKGDGRRVYTGIK